jgi:hypothetical protein
MNIIVSLTGNRQGRYQVNTVLELRQAIARDANSARNGQAPAQIPIYTDRGVKVVDSDTLSANINYVSE